MGIILGLLISCAPIEREGTIVGNPNKTKPSLAKFYDTVGDQNSPTELENPDFWYTGAEGMLIQIELSSPTGNTTTHVLDQHLTLLGDDSFSLPDGIWTALSITIEDIQISGFYSSGEEQNIYLERVIIDLYGPDFITENNEFTFEIADNGWLQSTVSSDLDNDITITESDYPLLYAAIAAQSALFLDLQGDGHLNSEERESTLIAAGPERDMTGVDFMETINTSNDSVSGETGCQSMGISSSSSALLSFFGFVLFSYRRKTTL